MGRLRIRGYGGKGQGGKQGETHFLVSLISCHRPGCSSWSGRVGSAFELLPGRYSAWLRDRGRVGSASWGTPGHYHSNMENEFFSR